MKKQLTRKHILTGFDWILFAIVFIIALSIIARITPNAEEGEICPTNEIKTTARETEARRPETATATKNEPTEPTTTPTAFFPLTEEQRDLVEQVVSAEARGEPYEGQVAVAQCLLIACWRDKLTPEEALVKYKYTTARVEPTESVKAAVSAVFDRGEGVTTEPILYFYNPALVTSEFHESQIFVMEIANHKFFKEAQQNAE